MRLGDVTTGRLALSRFSASDLDELARVFSHPEVWHFPYRRAMTRDETAAFLEGQLAEWDELGFGCWVARTLAGGAVIGYVGLSVPNFLPEILPAVEVGWRFAPTHWGQGYATEGASAALTEGFTTLGLERIVAVPETPNAASVRVAERLGMRLVRPVTIPANERRGELAGLLFEMGREEWPAAPPGAPS